MGQLEEARLLVKVATLYYEESLTQQEISERLRLSRPKVSRLLQQARDQGIVKIAIFPPGGVHAHLERALEQRFRLQDVVVVEAYDYASATATARELGVAAAAYLHRVVQPGDVIGLSWGRTLAAMVSNLQPEAKAGVSVVQITGGLGPPNAEVHASGLATRLAGALAAQVHLLAAPGVVDGPSLRAAFLGSAQVRRALEMAARANLAFVGIGTPTRESLLVQGGELMSWEELEELASGGAVGDVALHYFDLKGRPVTGSAISERMITVAAEALKKIPRVVGVAGGAGKFEAILGALRGGWINCLITDHVTARQLIECEVPVDAKQRSTGERTAAAGG